MQPVLRGRRDARLVRAVERARAWRRSADVVVVRRSTPSPPSASAAPPDAGAEEQLAAAERLGRRRSRWSRRRRSRPPARAARRARRSPARACACRRGQLGVGDEAVAAAVRRRAPSMHVVEALVDRRRRAAGRSRRRSGAARRTPACAPSTFASKSTQVDVRVALLLAGDLRLRHLTEQFDRAVRDLSRLELDRLHARLRARRRRS